MRNDSDKQSIPDKIRKAIDYYSYFRITKLYSEITQLSDKDILIQVCELFEDSIEENTDDGGRLRYEYVTYALIPTYEQYGDATLLNKCLEQLEIAERCSHDCDLLRDIYVAKAKVHMLLNQFSSAERYILIAYNDYDYRTSTFSLLMKILDSQCKFDLMIMYLKEYCTKFQFLHEKIHFKDLQFENISKSEYLYIFKKVLEG